MSAPRPLPRVETRARSCRGTRRGRGLTATAPVRVGGGRLHAGTGDSDGDPGVGREPAAEVCPDSVRTPSPGRRADSPRTGGDCDPPGGSQEERGAPRRSGRGRSLRQGGKQGAASGRAREGPPTGTDAAPRRDLWGPLGGGGGGGHSWQVTPLGAGQALDGKGQGRFSRGGPPAPGRPRRRRVSPPVW